MGSAKVCRLCMQSIELEHTTTACPRCGTQYHSGCWEDNPNCRYEQCPNAVASAAAPAPAPEKPAKKSNKKTKKMTEPVPSNNGEPPAETPVIETPVIETPMVETPEAGPDGDNYMTWVNGEEGNDGNKIAAFYQGRQALAPDQRLERLTRTSLPVRVKAGEINEKHLGLDTANGRFDVAWDSVEFICLGVIEDQVGDGPANRSGLRNMVRKLFFGENNNEQARRKTRDTSILDVYVRQQQAPYRFEAINVNYRSFLGRVSYISAKNFSRLVARIAFHSRESCLDGSTVAFLEATRERIRRYASVNDFELESTLHRERLESQQKRSSIEIGQDLMGFDERDLGESDEAAAVPNHTKE